MVTGVCDRAIPEGGVGVSGGVGVDGGSPVGLRGVVGVGELGILIGAVGVWVIELRGLDFVARWRETRSLAGVGGKSLRFRCRGCRLGRLARWVWRVGDTRASLVDDEEAGMADRDLDEGSACEDRRNAGEGKEPRRRASK
jgi:hypothetical protein